VILLDTNALIWVDAGHPRARRLTSRRERIYISPASLLELQLLQEAGKVRVRNGIDRLALEDDRWLLDEPASGVWLLRAADMSWTRDPFDRLIVAHAQLRGWRLATADRALLDRLGASSCVEL
jgi:PIN domain nuclease of toxin-antitoxin system